jgi:hypothetical protein
MTSSRTVELTEEEVEDLLWTLEVRVQDELRMAYETSNRQLAQGCQRAAARLERLMAKLEEAK